VGGSLAALLLGWIALPPALFAGSGEHTSFSGGRDAYVLKQGDHFCSTNISVDALEVMQGRFSGEFLWARRAGREYLIRDARVIEESQSLFAPLQKLDPERSDLERRQSRLGAEEADLESEQEEVEQEVDRLDDDSDRRGDDAARRRLEGRKRDLGAKLRALESKERELEVIERSIDQREDALEQKAERELWRLIDKAIAGGLAEPVK
jgi:hypothetical protein